uniref:NADH-ubiquinone oxidoreductase chain 6 n=1 Tax=Limnadia lenticularis TaxID=84336 RepID=A0A3G1RRW5_9CRUS|nr:NADH dehydrogenase subunit 6 [Limnadia lenticularis]AXH81658.1 NADH dehydrogenase subunit 6 [Limnadia lenticularis]
MMLSLFFIGFLVLIFTFIFLNHPLSMAVNLFFQTLILCLVLNTAGGSPWYSYILFLVFLGGLLVIFAYVSAFASNEKFNVSILNSGVVLISAFFFSFDCGGFKGWGYYERFFWVFQLLKNWVGNYFYTLCFGGVTLFLVMYLLLSLLIVVRLNRMAEGPLRSF